MKEFRNRQGSTDYGLVDTLRIHLWYDEDDNLQEDLDRLFRKGNEIIKKRGQKRKNASETFDDSEDTNKRSSESDEDEDDNNLNRGEV